MIESQKSLFVKLLSNQNVRWKHIRIIGLLALELADYFFKPISMSPRLPKWLKHWLVVLAHRSPGFDSSSPTCFPSSQTHGGSIETATKTACLSNATFAVEKIDQAQPSLTVEGSAWHEYL